MSEAAAAERRERIRRHRERQLRKQSCRKATGGRQPCDPSSEAEVTDESPGWETPCSNAEHMSMPGFSPTVKWLLDSTVEEDLRGLALGAGAYSPDGERRFHVILHSVQSIVRKAQANGYNASDSDMKGLGEQVAEMSEFLGINVATMLYHLAANRNPYDYEDIYDL